MRYKRRTLVWIGLILAALAGMALVWIATRYGPGVGGDATIYLTSARNLINGVGLGWIEADGSFRSLPYTPPFYPLVLSALGLFTTDLVSAARWWNVLLFGATIVMTGWAVLRVSASPLLALLCAVALAFSPVIVGVQVWAMSEPLFLFLGFAGLFLLLEYFNNPRRWLLVICAVLAGLAFLTRYMGIAYVLTGALALLLFGRGRDSSIRLRWNAMPQAILFGVIAILPILAWLVIDFTTTGTVGSRSAQPVSAYWQRFLEIGPALERIVLFWLLPDSVINRLPGLLRAGLWLAPLLLLAGLAAVLARRRASPDPLPAAVLRLPRLMGLFILVYLVVLAAVQVFTYPPITLAARMLSPVHFAALLLVFALLYRALVTLLPHRRMILAFAVLAAAGFVALYGLRSARIAQDYNQSGIGYTAPSYRDSAIVAAIRALPQDVPLISNETTAIMFLANRPAYALQEIYQEQPQAEFTRYGSGDDAAQRVFAGGQGALVLFSENLFEDFGKYGERAGERIDALTEGLYVYYQGEDGAIYFAQPPDFAAP